MTGLDVFTIVWFVLGTFALKLLLKQVRNKRLPQLGFMLIALLSAALPLGLVR
jgi:hypothetical protein